MNVVLNTWKVKIMNNKKIAYNCKNNQVKKMIHNIKWLLQTNSMFNTFRACSELFCSAFHSDHLMFWLKIEILSHDILSHRQSLVISFYIGVTRVPSFGGNIFFNLKLIIKYIFLAH